VARAADEAGAVSQSGSALRTRVSSITERVDGRGLHSSTFQLNLRRPGRKHTRNRLYFMGRQGGRKPGASLYTRDRLPLSLSSACAAFMLLDRLTPPSISHKKWVSWS